jgi:FtsP/CotA-like multicopper oxidase with cupredoxin domain
LVIVVFLILTLIASVADLTIGEAAARYGGGGCGGGGCGGGSQPQVIDPPKGQAFKDPAALADQNPDPNVFEATLEAKPGVVNLNGIQANLLTFNGFYPGPTINIKSGETLKLHFKNSLPASGSNILGYERGITNVHTHGFHVSPKEPADAAHLMIMPKETYDYVYDTSKQPAGAMCFYHCHIHGLTAEQYWAGLAGAIIVQDPTNLLSPFETHTMVIKDISLAGSEPSAYSSMDYMKGKEGTIVTVNGQVNPVLNIQPGEVQRWHVLNACNARFLKLSLQQHGLQLIGTDGGLLDKPYNVPELLIAPGERVDLLVKATQTTGSFKLLSLPYDRGCGSPLQTVTIMTVTYSGTRLNQNAPATINSAATRLNMDTSSLPHRQLTLSMGMGRGYINGQDFDVSPYTIMSQVGTYEVWEISVRGGMDHPFHFHINHAQVLSISGGDQAYASLYTNSPAWKDTIIVPKMGKITILVSIQDYTGMTMFHCHIVEHEDIGMMGMWHIMDMNEPMPMQT